mmetsp:Transcript_39869/g.55395  ORF Transcript_39869/g.55395 Transcript_39869/m.55395 type:complete len:340 (-) Transcript_39869:296-1315(-)|eukprot:CAMPEP_0196579334 /NCGR_PEP_ID=MMETSP1081-20130531/20338_1 /TAXON_ID=36882 /ORGANISM="Pyramimonas amylifera, Strain CCMP720" /LENGTH=339 /DNA_ID=CAMNT_0041898879 /DNA_START=380 /DNA_END=1399 /DNA_ORIENTATION=+
MSQVKHKPLLGMTVNTTGEELNTDDKLVSNGKGIDGRSLLNSPVPVSKTKPKVWETGAEEKYQKVDKSEDDVDKTNNSNNNLAEDTSVITQYIPPSNASNSSGSLDQAGAKGRRSTWSSILCCVRPQEGYESGQMGGLGSSQLPYKPTPPPYYGKAVCPPKQPRDFSKKTLVLDLDETLVHSSFKPVNNADYIIPVEIDNKVTDVYVIKRPWVDKFMDAMSEMYEVVVFTASLAKYADPLLDLLDPRNQVRLRLFRDSCCPFEGNYVKDLSRLGRDIHSTIIIDNSPHSYVFQPENAIPIGTFIGDNNDKDLLELIPFLTDLKDQDDVRDMLQIRYPNH